MALAVYSESSVTATDLDGDGSPRMIATPFALRPKEAPSLSPLNSDRMTELTDLDSFSNRM